MRSKAKNPFKFMTTSSLVSVTGQKARNVKELLDGIKAVPGASIYQHSHQVYREWHSFGRPPIHDFAYWVGEVLREKSLGEKLAAIDPTQFDDIRGFRLEVIGVIEHHLKSDPIMNQAPPESAFHFCQAISMISDTGLRAGNLDEFISSLGKITKRTLYYHLFEARLRLQRHDNDFSIWFHDELDAPKLAEEISKIDITIYNLEQIRAHLFIILAKYRGISPMVLIKEVVKLPTDVIELLLDTVSFPVRSLNRFLDKKLKRDDRDSIIPKHSFLKERLK